MKLLIIKNNYTKRFDYTKAIEWFEKRTPLRFQVEEKKTNFPLTFSNYGNHTYVGYGLSPESKDIFRTVVPEGVYDMVAVIYGDSAPGVRVPATNWNPLYKDTEFIQIAIPKAITLNHEMMHALFMKIKRKNIVIDDPMDFVVFEGRGIPYFNNESWDMVPSNRSIALDRLAPYWSILMGEKPKPTMKPTLRLGSKGDAVKELQTKIGINADGVFGRQTQEAVKAFQRLKGLFVDGVVGKNTWNALGGKLSLVEALIMVESGGDDYAVGDQHLKHLAYGCLQLTAPYIEDCNKKLGTSYTTNDVLGNRDLSIQLFNTYMSIYEPNGTDEEKARCHNGGAGWRKNRKATDGYWNKVKVYL